MGEVYSTHGSEEKCIQFFVEIPEGKRPLGRHNCGWDDNIRIHLKEIEWEAGFTWLRAEFNHGKLLE
jgi:hypothetical protein